MENPEEILHSLEEFSKMKPKDIPRELEEYLCFVAKTGNPVYQWPIVKSLFREKLLSVITEFYDSCPSVDIPPCPNVEMFNYDLMKNFILEKLDTFAAAPFTVQRICELLTTPRKEYNRIDKYMRALEKNILVVSTTEPGRRSTENGEGIMNGIESEHLPESSNSSHDINVEEMDESPTWPRTGQVAPVLFDSNEAENQSTTEIQQISVQDTFENGSATKLEVSSSTTATSTQPQLQNQETVITCRSIDEMPYVSIEPVPLNTCTSHQENVEGNQADSSVTITAVPAGVQQRRNSVERVGTTENLHSEAEKVKQTAMPESTEGRLSEKGEETHTLKEQISSTTPSAELLEKTVTETKVTMSSEETALDGQEELGIENISPENSSSSPETLQIETNTEQEKNQPEKEKIEPPSEPLQAEEKQNILEGSEWSEVKQPQLQEECEDSDVSTTDIKDQDLDGIPIEPSEEVTFEEQTEECKSSDRLIEDPSERDSPLIEEQVDIKEAEPVHELPLNDLQSKVDSDETPMEIDVISETKLEEKEESVANEPSSTSDAAAL